MNEHWQSRTELLIGEDGLKKLAEARVLVVGLGGVGGAAAEMLVRAGVGDLTIADSDTIQPSNRNRQIVALSSNENLLKAEAMAARLKDISPSLRLHTETSYLKDEAMVRLLERGYDYVVDAIDTLSPKVYLIVHGMRMGLRIVSSMGSGSKLDPCRVRVADLSETNTCPFAYDIRKRLRRLGIETGVRAVFSDEKPVSGSFIHSEGQNKKSTLGNISYMPMVFGCVCASVVIRELTGM